MSKAKPSRAELEQEIETLRNRVRELESHRITSTLAEESAMTSASEEVVDAPLPGRSADRLEHQPPADVLCLASAKWQNFLETVCRELGHRPVFARKSSDLKQIQGRFALVIAASAKPESPFCAPTMNRLLSKEVPGIVVERGLMLGAMAPFIGHQFAHLHRGSSFCRIPEDPRTLGDKDRKALRAAITDVLSLPPHKDVNYYDEVSDHDVHCVLESSLAPIIVVDRSWHVWFTNIAAQAVFRRPTYLMKNLHIRDLFASDVDARRFQERAETPSWGWYGTTSGHLRSRDGHEFEASIAYRHVYGGSHDGSWVLTFHDITPIIHARRQLQESERRYRELVQHVSDITYEIDGQGRFLHLSPNVEAWLGFKAEALIGANAFDVVHPADLHIAQESFRKVTGTETEDRFEFRCVDAAGQSKWGDVTSRAFRSPTGEPGVSGVLRDITSRKQAEEELRQRNALLQSVLDNTQSAIAVRDEQGRHLLVNRTFCQILGIGPADAIGKTVFDIYPRPFAEKALAQDQQVIQTGQPLDIEDKAEFEDRTIYYIATKVPLTDSDGKPFAVCAVASETTEQRKREKELREKHELLQRILDNTLSVIDIKDAEGRFVLVNRAFEQQTGKNADEVVGRTSSEIYGSDVAAPFLEQDRKVLETGQPLTTEDMFEVQGEDHLFLVTKVPLFDADSKAYAVCGLGTDITELKRTERQLQEKDYIIESASSVIATADLDGRMTYVNPVFLKTWGFDDPGEILGRHFPEFWEVQHRRDEIMHALRNEGTWSDEIQARRKDGTLFDVQVSAAMVRDRQGNPVSLMSSSVDITERKRAERDLRDSEQRNRNLFDQVINSVTIVDARDGSILEFNESACRNLGYSREEFAQLRISDLDVLEDETAVKARMEQILQSGSAEFETKHRTKDGRIRDVLVRSKPIITKGRQTFMSVWSDITDRKRAAEALRASEQEKATVLNSVSELVVFQDRDLRVKWANRAAGESVGASPTDLLGRHCYEIWHGRDTKCDCCPVHKAMETGTNQKEEVHDPYGRDYLISGTPVLDEGGEVVGAVETALEITDRKRAEEELLRTRNQLQYLISNNPSMLYTSKASGDYGATWISDNVEQITGYEPGQFTEEASFWLDRIHPDDRSRVLAELPAIFEKNRHTHEYRWRCKDGHYIWVRDSSNLIRHEDGSPKELVGVWSDITQEKETQEALLASERRFRQVVEGIPVIVYSAEAGTNRFLLFAGAAEQILGLRPEELYANPGLGQQCIHPDDRERVDEEYKKGLSRGEPFEIEQRVVHASTGEIHWIRGRVMPVLNADGELIRQDGVMLDMTERRQAEAEAHRAQSQLDHMMRVGAIGELAAGIAHEVNQPLCAIVTNAGIAQNALEVGEWKPGDIEEILRDIHEDGKRAGEVIAHLRSFLERREVKQEEVQINDVIRKALAFALRAAKEQEAATNLDLADDLPVVSADHIQLQQVVVNLVNNALDAMSRQEQGQPQLTIRSELDSQGKVVVSVSDNGAGLPDSTKEKLFEPFFTTKPDGLGIGLSSSRSLIEAHRGRIWASQNPDGGATFCFALPPKHS
jgi:PAS domain S-box-containing protein